MKNCIAGYSTNAGISSSDEVQNLIMNNIVLDSLYSISENGAIACLLMDQTEAVINNLIMSNSASHEYGVFQYDNNSVNDLNHTLTMSNSLVINNFCNQGYMWGGTLNIRNKFETPYKLNNITIANNHLTWWAMMLVGNININNCIIYNPELEHELCVASNINIPKILNLDYSLVRGGFNNLDIYSSPTINWGSHNIDANPSFWNGDPAKIASYRLNSNSPCINTGTPDTTGLELSPFDLLGNPRINGDRIDMGCFEYDGNHDDNQVIIAQKRIHLKNYPNPIYLGSSEKGGNPYTIFEFNTIEKIRHSAQIDIFNIKGQKVKSLKTNQNIADMAKSVGLSQKDTEMYKANCYSLIWNAKDENFRSLPSGVYLYQLSIDGEKKAVNKLMILK